MARSIHVDGMQHSTPIPAAARVGNFIASGLINGRSLETGEMPADIEGQCRQMFANIKTVVEAAGGNVDSILRITVWMNDRSLRAALNEAWVAMFPDPAARPARLTINRELDQGKLVECEILAVAAA
ncbi:MAG TPA: RidA family protein [Pseudolabrys sp.]|nr:RidA family protein [Pseudolabrys sp.]